MLANGRRNVYRGRIWHSIRLQLGGALLFCAFLPYALVTSLSPAATSHSFYVYSLCVAAGAIVSGQFFMRQISYFPGIRSSYYVLPTFLSTFGVGIAILWGFRLEYSRPTMTASILLVLAWYYLVYAMTQRRRSLHIAVVPFGDALSLMEIPRVQWTRLSAPPPLPTRKVKVVAADLRAALPAEWEHFLAECALSDIAVIDYKHLRESLTGQVRINHLSENSFGSLSPDQGYALIKRLSDLILVLASLVVVIPGFFMIALVIRLDSPGPVFFRQERIGYRGRPFRVWKFRTMTHLTSEPDDAMQSAITTASDQRITRAGRFLRRSRLDEVPQMINVLQGDMSLIGPRPEAVVLSRWYERELPFYRYRHVVRPGISGWAQVNQGHVADLEDVLHKLSYDFYYISNFSFWLDILITFRTIRTMLTGFGAR